MEFIDLNTHGEIGANSTLISIGSFNILVDSGLHPKKEGRDAMPNFSAINGREIDLILLTHCHLDHIGSLPIISKSHPNAPIVTSIPNLTLAPRMLRNSINVMKRQREELGLTELPLYQHRDIDHVKNQLLALAFDKAEVFYKGSDSVQIIVHPAGHVAGASAFEIIHKHQRIVFSGDVLFEAQRSLPGAHLPKGKIDVLFLETTRGATERDKSSNRETEVDRLIESINAILERNGSCLIPVFALGRMQEIFKIIQESINFGILKKAPIYSTGLGIDICNYFDKIHKKTGLIDFEHRILDQLKIKAPDPKLRPGKNIKNKGIYIVSSGMMVEHTPSYKLAASLLAHKENGICFVGYNDPDTPGGKLLASNESDSETFYFRAYDYLSPLRASIEQFDLSGHADRESLLNYAVQSDARAIVLNHGETAARKWFEEQLNEQVPQTKIINPNPCQPIGV